MLIQTHDVHIFVLLRFEEMRHQGERQLFFVRMMKWLFTQRNKKLGKAIAPFIKASFKLSKQDAETLSLSLPYSERRVRELSPADFGVLSNALSQ